MSLRQQNVRRIDDVCEVAVWDADTTSEDDYIGTITINLRDLLLVDEVNKWYRIGEQVGAPTIARRSAAISRPECLGSGI